MSSLEVCQMWKWSYGNVPLICQHMVPFNFQMKILVPFCLF